jgi:tol-pal system protein YbgF
MFKCSKQYERTQACLKMSGLVIFFNFEFLSFDIVSYFDIRISSFFSARKKTNSIINGLISHSAFLGLFIAMFFLAGLPACTPVKNLSKPEEDPRFVALQQEMDRIAESNSATRQKVEDIYNCILALQPKVDSLEANLDELAGQPMLKSQAQVTLPPPKASDALTPTGEVKPTPEKPEGPGAKLKKASVSSKLSPELQYKKAHEAYAKHLFDEAIALFKEFLQLYPKHDLADNAQYWIGENYYDMKDYPNAILAFKEVMRHYEEGGKAPDALLKIGYSYVALDDPENARIYLEGVIKNYPFSEAEVKARAKLKELENL